MDIRSQRTRAAITESFLQALKVKPASKITVTDICDRASINRSTFYKHYLDIPDLQAQMEETVLADFEAFLRSGDYSDDTRYRTVLIEMLTYMKVYGYRFYMLCSNHAGSDLPTRVFRLINEHGFPAMRGRIPEVGEEKAELLYQFLTHGCGGLLIHWFREDSTLTVEELADFILQISCGMVDAAMGKGK